MKFFIDTAKVEDIKAANDMGVICGVTTNQSLSGTWSESHSHRLEDTLDHIYRRRTDQR